MTGTRGGHPADKVCQRPASLYHEDILILDAVLLALVHLAFLQSIGPVAWEIAMSSIYGPPAVCNTPLHVWLYYTQAEKSEYRCSVAVMHM
jgi:hypothetical protein